MWFQILVCGLFANDVGLFADNVGLKGVLFAINLVPKIPCLQVEAILIRVDVLVTKEHLSFKTYRATFTALRSWQSWATRAKYSSNPVQQRFPVDLLFRCCFHSFVSSDLF
jgi:hypothetical protein